jgi:hypothetical protein
MDDYFDDEERAFFRKHPDIEAIFERHEMFEYGTDVIGPVFALLVECSAILEEVAYCALGQNAVDDHSLAEIGKVLQLLPDILTLTKAAPSSPVKLAWVVWDGEEWRLESLPPREDDKAA